MVKARKQPRKTENPVVLKILEIIVKIDILYNSPKTSYILSTLFILEFLFLYWCSKQEFIYKEIIPLILLVMVAIIIQLSHIVIYGVADFIYNEQLNEIRRIYDNTV